MEGSQRRSGVVLNQNVYLGKDGKRSREGLGYDAVRDLIKPFQGKQHHVYFDNFFCGPKLLEDLFVAKTYACGYSAIETEVLPQLCTNKLKRGEKIVVQKGQSNLVFTKWHVKKDVCVLSTNSDPTSAMVQIERRQQGVEIEQVEKPQPVVLYNKSMGGVDHSDQLRS